jgi:hypothetical protein
MDKLMVNVLLLVLSVHEAPQHFDSQLQRHETGAELSST